MGGLAWLKGEMGRFKVPPPRCTHNVNYQFNNKVWEEGVRRRIRGLYHTKRDICEEILFEFVQVGELIRRPEYRHMFEGVVYDKHDAKFYNDESQVITPYEYRLTHQTKGKEVPPDMRIKVLRRPAAELKGPNHPTNMNDRPLLQLEYLRTDAIFSVELELVTEHARRRNGINSPYWFGEQDLHKIASCLTIRSKAMRTLRRVKRKLWVIVHLFFLRKMAALNQYDVRATTFCGRSGGDGFRRDLKDFVEDAAVGGAA